MTEQVTKIKNEGRVAAGKRLVEWNSKQTRRTCSRTRSKSSQVVIQVFLAETQAINKNRKVIIQSFTVVELLQCSSLVLALLFTFIAEKSPQILHHLKHHHLSLTFFA